MIQTIRQNSIVPLFFTMLLLCWGPVTLQAELPDFVREDVGLCLQVREIPAWTEEIKSSEIRTRLEAAPFFQRWKSSGNYTGLKTTIRELENMLGRPLSDVLRSTFGQEILLAVYPDAGEKPAGVIMTRPANRKQTQELIDLWNRLEGAVIVSVDDRYRRRTSPKGPQLFYFLSDELFAMSDREELIAELAELGPAGFENSLAHSVRWKRAIESLEEANWAIAYFQPDRWKHHLTVEHRDSFEEALFQQIGRMESLAAGVEGRNGLHVRMNLLYPADSEPVSLRTYRELHSEPIPDWSELSARTILMVVGQGGPDFLAEFLKQHATRSRDALAGFEVVRGLLLGRDPLEEVLPLLGRHWMVSVSSQPGRADFPWDFVFQLEFEESTAQNSASSRDGNPARSGLHQSLQNLVRTAVRIAGVFLSPSLENRPRMFSETLPEEVTIDGFETELGLSPAIGIGKRKMVAANSRELVERSFGAGNDLSDAKKLSIRLTRVANRCNLGFYLNLNELRSSLASHSEALFRFQNIDEQQRAKAKLRLARQMEVFSLVDTAYLFGVISKDLVSFHFGVESLPGDR